MLKTIAGLLKDQPKKGIIEFNGRQIHRLAPERISSMGIVYVPEDRGLFPGADRQGKPGIGLLGPERQRNQDDLEYVYELFPILKERTSQQAETLSGGEQQMLAMARAMLRRPKLLMLDEPSLGLAPMVARSVYEALDQDQPMGDHHPAGGTERQIGPEDRPLRIHHGSRPDRPGRNFPRASENEDVQELYLGLGGEAAASPKGWRLYKKRRRW